MAEEMLGPLAPKQKRYNLRSSVCLNSIEFGYIEIPQSKRKQRNEIDLLNLNDDCLLEMFKYLRPIDLRNVSQVNQQLNDLVKYYVRLKYKIQETMASCFNFATHDDRLNFTSASLCAKIFGHEIRLITISGLTSNFNVLEILKYCTENKLTIKLTDAVLSIESIVWNKWFQQLEHLSIANIRISNYQVRDLIHNNPYLKRLSIVNCVETSTWFFQYLPFLKNLEAFEFKKSYQTRNISTYLNNDLRYLLGLKKLKVLKFGFQKLIIYSAQELLNKFVENGIAIEHLELWNERSDNALLSIGQLETIKILKLNNLIGRQGDHILHIAKNLKLLQELHVRTETAISSSVIEEVINTAKGLTCLKIDAKDIHFVHRNVSDIQNSVKNRTEKITLKLEIYVNGRIMLDMNSTKDKFRASNNLNNHHLFEQLTCTDKKPTLRFFGEPKVHK